MISGDLLRSHIRVRHRGRGLSEAWRRTQRENATRASTRNIPYNVHSMHAVTTLAVSTETIVAVGGTKAWVGSLCAFAFKLGT